jgi:stage V sporulation protein K
MSPGYSKIKLFQIGHDNFNKLSTYCDMLLDEGYWEKPESVLNKTIKEMLDLYVQAILVQLAIHLECYNEDERSFILEISGNNTLGISLIEDDKELIIQTERIIKAPPILLQLCSLRDIEKSTCIAGLFFDTLLNILLAMAHLNDSKSIKSTSFIMDYYHRVNAFLKANSKLSYVIDDRYVFRKISCDDIELNSLFQVTANGDYTQDKNGYKVKNENKLTSESVSNIEINKQKSYEEIKDTNQQISDDEIKETNNQEILDNLLKELNSLIGLDVVKNEINSLINLIKVRKLREEYNLPTMDMSYHMVYTGNPGTGKTTVARLVAKIYKELGILTKGNLVETDRAGLVAGFVGQTALKVKEVVDQAIGGVLFIDEAYSLAGGIGTSDFGGEAIDILVKLMEDNRDNLVVIVAGYRDEMQKFLKANSGLISRFNKFIEFSEYTNDELILILNSMAQNAGYSIEDIALNVVFDKLNNMDVGKRMEFGNARGIRNVFEKIVVNQANRLVTYEKPTKHQLTEILAIDINDVL